MKAAQARGRKGGRPRIMTPEDLRYAQNRVVDRTRSNPDIRRQLGDIRMSTLYHYLRADGTFKDPGRRLRTEHARPRPVRLGNFDMVRTLSPCNNMSIAK